MKLGQIYEFVVKKGMELDPREKKEIEALLKRAKEEYEKLKGVDKESYDVEKLKHPYADTRILVGDPETEVRCVLVGIDMEVGEVLLADRLREKGRRVDLILSHHPEGRAYAQFYEVMGMQADILHRLGVPINVAESLLEPRIKEVARRVLPANHTRAVDVARLLDIPMMCCHTPADNAVTKFLQDLFDEKQPRTVGDVIDILKEIPEYQHAMRNSAGPTIFVGSKDRRAGRIFVDMTGGTEGSEKAMEKLAQAGVGTIVGMHMGDKLREEAEKNHINVIIAGHIASDTLGLNLMLDEIIKELGELEIIECSGFLRVSRIQ